MSEVASPLRVALAFVLFSPASDHEEWMRVEEMFVTRPSHSALMLKYPHEQQNEGRQRKHLHAQTGTWIEQERAAKISAHKGTEGSEQLARERSRRKPSARHHCDCDHALQIPRCCCATVHVLTLAAIAAIVCVFDDAGAGSGACFESKSIFEADEYDEDMEGDTGTAQAGVERRDGSERSAETGEGRGGAMRSGDAEAVGCERVGGRVRGVWQVVTTAGRARLQSYTSS